MPILMGFSDAAYIEDTEYDARIPELGPRNNENDSDKDKFLRRHSQD